MTLRSEEACAALAAWLTAAAGLPDCTRNDMRLTGFAPTATPGVGWKLALVDGDVTTSERLLSDPPEYELEIGADILLAVEGLPGPGRDGVFADAMQALAAALTADETLGAAVDGMTVDGRVERDHLLPETGQLPIETARVTVTMTVTAMTPLG